MSGVVVDPSDPRVKEFIDKNVDKTNRTLLVIDNTPKAEPEKIPKLTGYLRNKIKDKTSKAPVLLKLPTDDAGVTLGFAFAAFEKADDADEVVRVMNGLKMDKSHTLKVNLFSDWDRYKDVPAAYTPPTIDMDNFTSENLYEYLCDDQQREQFFVRYHSTTGLSKHKVEINWNDFQVIDSTDALETTKKIYSRDNWTTLFAKWSPLGTYFVTFHPKKISLWGGPQFSVLGEFPHTEVQFIDFSPKEKYLITWGSELIVWNVQICKKVRRVQVPYTPGERCPYKWSHDEQFLLKKSSDGVLLYDMDRNMYIVQPNKERATTLQVPGICDIAWSPTDNFFCYWVPEANNTPARVTLVQVVTKTLADGTKDIQFSTIAQRNLYRVENIRMTWHPQGDYLACKVERKKKPNQIVSTYEMFRIRHKDLAVETIELAEQVIAFDFEPKGHRFALIHGPSDVKLSVSFYTMNSKSGGVQLLGTFKDKKVNHIYWSPKGKYCLLAGLKQPFNGVLEFWNVHELELIESADHFMCSNVNWDASGRFITTFVSQAYHQIENGFKTWTFQGKVVSQRKMEKFYQFEWRPRPQSGLSEKDFQKLVEKKRPTWEKKFQDEETWILERGERERKEKMNKEWTTYRSRIAAIRKEFANANRERRELQIKSGARLEFKEVMQTVEEIVDRKEVRISRT